MKNILLITFTIFISLSFTACGGSSDGGEIVEVQKASINIDTYCVDNPTLQAIETYEILQSGDTLVKDENGTVVETYHDENDNKKVCLVNGSAHILR